MLNFILQIFYFSDVKLMVSFFNLNQIVSREILHISINLCSQDRRWFQQTVCLLSHIQ